MASTESRDASLCGNISHSGDKPCRLVFQNHIAKAFCATYSLRIYTFSVFFRCLLVFGISFIACFAIKGRFTDTFANLLLTSALSVVICTLVVYILGMTKNERAMVVKIVGKAALRLRTVIKR